MSSKQNVQEVFQAKTNRGWENFDNWESTLCSTPAAKTAKNQTQSKAAEEFYGPNDRLCGNAYACRMS